MNWQKVFGSVPDFRINRRKKHNLVDILVIALCAIVSGADDFEEIEAYGKRKEVFLRGFLELPNGIPSHDTFNRVFKYMDKSAFGGCLYRWSKELLGFIKSSIVQINVDGKVLCGTAKSGFKKSGICILSAWVAEHHLILGQEKVDAKSNEKTAIPELLKSLDLEGSLVSSDAAGCQLKNADGSPCDLIIEKGGDYLIAIKKDHKHMYEQITDWMSKRKKHMCFDEWIDFGSGRIEKRVCYVETQLALLDDLSEWKHLKSIIMVEANREKGGKITYENRFYLSSLEVTAKEFNKLIRNHWSIENHLHWKLDVVFREDMSRTKTGNAAENMTTARKLALQLLNQVQDKESVKNRRKTAGWDDNYLLNILKNLTKN
ncbi:putative transposase YbfD/YdcC [Catalinimonas alkaloidigena]|uniref:ISAs1 family transposase n=1 Tax=Catalinimonas alkaloidigena TaxID=1075417 RepID=UPI002405C021|nr:ISAs1 family transposase [Catalinimonas alkaloidigena]MDF9795473.1 putative transposase YbfD/YdcC [Catalinimonas alkaloidigena]MDF9795821.1 putative transposase YbfD/YdcC [Catalinimonas alkaloidigena]MDF9797024.1 putative transposase YbfD/YdcC [Catalinimonas alkaloidigena]